jgi:sugar lactone lactonase YvrE
MDNPFGVAVDNSGTLWVADIFNSRVLRFDGAATKPNGASAEGVLGQPDFTSSAFATTTTGMTFPTGVTVGSSGTLWVADEGNSRVLRFDHAARKPNGAAANGVLGQPDFTSRTPVTTANGMYFPTGVTVDHYGTLWVADSTNNRVLRFDHAARKPNGAAANGVLGQPDFTSNGYATTANAMNHPAHVAQDPTGSLWVTDSWNNRVLLFATE